MTAERLRERQVHRYYQSWLSSSIGFNNAEPAVNARYHSDGSLFQASKDKSLTAFAQLACLRLNVKRALVTLISTERQYILAEATKTLSLITDTADDDQDDSIWFGNASIPRAQGISGDALDPGDYTGLDTDGKSFTTPALVISDITESEQYKNRGYAGRGVRFYAGIPILTSSGEAIGVYTVTDESPRQGLTAKELCFMHDMSNIVMKHLDIVKGEAARYRGETMILGLGKFVQGGSSIGLTGGKEAASHEQAQAEIHARKADKGEPESPPPSKTRQDPYGFSITAADPSLLRPKITSVRSVNSLPTRKLSRRRAGNTSKRDGTTINELSDSTGADRDHHSSSTAQDSDYNQNSAHVFKSKRLSKSSQLNAQNNTFSRAANILRECASADGVLFFDAVSTNLAKRSSTTGFQSAELNKKKGIESGKHGDEELRSHSDGDSNHGGQEEGPCNCPLLGYSVDVTDQTSTNVADMQQLALSERTLRRLIRKFPSGKIFFFTENQTLSYSENELSASAGVSSDNLGSTRIPADNQAPSRTVNGRKTSSTFVEELKRVVPHAQCVIWLPLWDFSKQRWSAGSFLWSRRSERLVVAQDDLVYLRTFANSIMVEIARLDAASADAAKSTFIANISHELRSPLHGILGTVDLLQDTNLDDFQASLAASIEICGKTLSDTVDHVLDYAKINQLSRKAKAIQARKGSVSESKLSDHQGQHLSLEDKFDLSELVEEAIEAVYASYSFQQNPPEVEEGDGRRSSVASDDANQKAANTRQSNKNVQMIFHAEYRKNWWVRAQPGAVRRILTNIIGNALKYTDRGYVKVNLSSDHSTADSINMTSDNEDQHYLNVVLSVTDTGRGMSEDFVRNHAFTPYAQESAFSAGTGLGLSIVQMIVDSLGGSIELDSKQDIGTEIKILLKFPQDSIISADKTTQPPTAEAQVQSGNVSMSFLRPTDKDTISMEEHKLSDSIAETAKAWFDIDITTVELFREHKSDIYLYTEMPNRADLLELCRADGVTAGTCIVTFAPNAHTRHMLFKKCSQAFTDKNIHFEILTHPLGPHKLAGVLKRARELRTQPRRAIQWRAMSREDTDDSTGRRDQRRLINTEASWPEQSEQPQKQPKSPPSSKWSPGRVIALKTAVSDVEGQSKRNSSTPKRPRVRRHVTDQSIVASLYSTVSESSPIPEARAAAPFFSDAFPQISTTVNGSPAFSEMSPGAKPTTLAIDESFSALPLSASTSSAPSALANEAPGSTLTLRNHVRVLLVDDNAINLNILKTALRRAKHAFEFATNGLEALEAFKDAASKGNSFSHILMDISMPVMDGIESTALIREYERERSNRSNRKSRTSDVDVQSRNFVPSGTDKDSSTEDDSSRLKKNKELYGSGRAQSWKRASTASAPERLSPASFVPTPNPALSVSKAMIIALSGVASQQTQQDMFNAGADMFFPKPVKLKELIKLFQSDSV